MTTVQTDSAQLDFIEKLTAPFSLQDKISSVSINGQTLDTTPVFEAYWYFAAERQRIFLERVKGANTPELTSDQILQQYKFTNSFRASDRTSQYLIRNVIYGDDAPQDSENLFFRIMLFKLFNKIETWETLEKEVGCLSTDTYQFELFDQILTEQRNRGNRIYSAAYIMPSAGRVFGYKYKHQNHLKLIELLLDKAYPEKLSSYDAMSQGFELLMQAPSIGPFLAYQLITDLNYSDLTNFSEMEFVVAGPGALDGISKCFENNKQISPDQIISYMAENQSLYFDLYNIDFKGLWGRSLQLIDCQNIFCEISKYSRVAFPRVQGVAGRTRIKQKHSPKGRLGLPWYPPKWGLNEKITTVH